MLPVSAAPFKEARCLDTTIEQASIDLLRPVFDANARLLLQHSS